MCCRRMYWLLRKVSLWTLVCGLMAAPNFPQGPAVQGSVSHSGGKPLAGAEVELIAQTPAAEFAAKQLAGKHEEQTVVARTRSDKSGRFQVTSPQVGRYRLRVSHPQYLSSDFYLDPLRVKLQIPAIELPRRSGQRVRILDEKGQPVADLPVAARGRSEAWQKAERDGWWPSVRWEHTDAEGWVTVPVHPAENVSIAAVLDSRFAYTTFEPRKKPVTVRLMAMSPAQILTADGRPAVGVYGGFRWPFVATGQADDRGRMLLPLDDDDKISLRFLEGSVVHRSSRFEEVEDDLPRIYLPSVLQIQGRLVDAEDGTPLAGAFVWVSYREFRTTDRSGSFELLAASGGRGARFTATAEGYVERQFSLDEGQDGGGPRTFALRPSRTLRGQVVNAAGEPLANAEIRVALDWRAGQGQPGSNRRWVSLRTGGDGLFEIPKLDRDAGYLVMVERDGYGSEEVAVPPLSEGQAGEEDLLITLQAGIRVVGLVLNDAEQPIPGATVELVEPREGRYRFKRQNLGIQATTDAEGRFRIDRGKDGRYVLVAHKDGFSDTIVPGIEIQDFDEEVDLGVVYLGPTLELRGQVVDREDKPIAGADIRASIHNAGLLYVRDYRSLEAQTGPDGRFVLSGLQRQGQMYLRVSHRDYQPVSMPDIRGGGEPIRVVLEPGLALSGTVVDGQGEPVSRIDVLFQSGSNNTRRRTSDAGAFEFTGLVPGLASLHARGTEGISDPVDVNLSFDEPPKAVRLVLKPGGILRGLLHGPDGSPVVDGRLELTILSKGTISAMHQISMRMMRARHNEVSDGDGRFRFVGLDSGDYRIRAVHPDFQPVTQTVSLQVGTEADVVVAFEERLDRTRLRLAGLVQGDVGPASGATVHLVGESGTDHAQTVAGENGAFELFAPREGVYRVRAEHPDYARTLSEPVSLDGQATPEIVIQMERGATISGQIHGLDFDMLADVQISAVSRGGFINGAVSFDGTYKVENLMPGEWSVTARLQAPYRSVSGRVTVGGPGDEANLDLEFGQGYDVDGVVRRNGEPLRQGRVFLSCDDGYSVATTLDTQGSFRFAGVPEGTCLARVHAARSDQALRRTIEVRGPESVVIEYTAATVTGQILHEIDRVPIAGASVQLHEVSEGLSHFRGEILTRQDGRFQFADVPEGEWNLSVRKSGFEQFKGIVSISGASQDRQVLLRPSSPLALFVFASDGSVPQMVRFELRDAAGLTTAELHEPSSDGRVEMIAPPSGTYRLTVSAGSESVRDLEIQVPILEPLRIVLVSSAASPQDP